MKITIACTLIAALLSVDSCRPRTSRSKTSAQRNAPVMQQAGPSAQQIMNRADSVLAKVNSISAEPLETPEVNPEDYPRTPWGSTYIPKPDLSAYSTYEAGLANFTQGNYEQSLANFSQIVVTGRPAEMVPNAYYWMGESYFAMQRYADALPYFEYVAQAGPAFKRESAFYKLSLTNYRMGNSQAAGMWYERLMTEYPKSPLGKKLRKLGIR